MSEGIEFRLGYLTGKLKGYENEDTLKNCYIRKLKCIYFVLLDQK